MNNLKLNRIEELNSDPDIETWKENKIKIPFNNEESFFTPFFYIKYKNGKEELQDVVFNLTILDLSKIECSIPFLEKYNMKYKIIQRNYKYDDYIDPIIENYDNKFGSFQRISLLYSFMKMANNISNRSTCIRRKVGCIIAPNDLHNISSIGYNGSLPGEENGCRYVGSGKCGCIHAEINALNKFNNYESNTKYTLLCTLSPCKNCSEQIIKYPINKVIYLEEYRDISGLSLLKDNNIEVIKYNT